jgi:hypothetical protein
MCAIGHVTTKDPGAPSRATGAQELGNVVHIGFLAWIPLRAAAGRVVPPSSVTLPSSIAPRLRYLATRLHQLGPRPLFELLAEAVQGAPILDRLEVYGRLDPATVRALGADALPSLIVRIK